MLYQIDRVQRVNNNGVIQYHIFEFAKVDSIELFKQDVEQRLDSKYNHFTAIDNKKIKYLLNDKNLEKCIVHIIIYEKGDVNINDNSKKYVYISNLTSTDVRARFPTFESISRWFRELNRVSLDSGSKKLGSAKDIDDDTYVNNILSHIYSIENYSDDCGINLTKRFLEEEPTSAIDFDLFQYIESTNEYVIYEFLKRKNSNINNKQAHPMRYCWTGGNNDNKKKFISLWRSKQFWGGKLYLINYSNDIGEDISILEILDLDEELGIRAERKYCMSYEEFVNWLKNMNMYNSSSNNYLSSFKYEEYDSTYFDNFESNKKFYGK